MPFACLKTMQPHAIDSTLLTGLPTINKIDRNGISRQINQLIDKTKKMALLQSVKQEKETILDWLRGGKASALMARHKN